MEKIAYVLMTFNNPMGIIFAETTEELKEKTILAVKENLNPDEDAQFNLTIGNIGDWGESTSILVDFVEDGFLTQGYDEYSLIKSLCYIN